MKHNNEQKPIAVPSPGNAANAPVGRSVSIEIRRWDVLDIYFNEKDIEKIEALVDEYIQQGWEDPQWDEGGHKNYDSCVQLQKHHKFKNKRVR